MNDIQDALAVWENSLCRTVEVGGLFARNPVVHKWKAPHRSVILRETVCWRVFDLVKQAHLLYEADHQLGCRVLLRSAFESVAVLAYLNQCTRDVVSGIGTFYEFSDKTSRLLLGSKDKSTNHEAVNIITVLKRVERRVPGIELLYASLSESAHPNYAGLCQGYASVDRESLVTTFANNWSAQYAEGQPSHIEVCIKLFHIEYNNEWVSAFEALESWLAANDSTLTPRSGEDA